MPDLIVYPLRQNEMPQGCWECDMSCRCNIRNEDDQYESGRPKDCPLIEISGTRIAELLRGKDDQR